MMKRIFTTLDTKVLLSTLWIVVLINLLKADILSLYIPGTFEEVAEFAGSTPIPVLMLFGAILVEISTVMIIFSRVLTVRFNRWANIIAGVITLTGIWGAGSTMPHYIFIASIETICLVTILWTAWSWTEEAASVEQTVALAHD